MRRFALALVALAFLLAGCGSSGQNASQVLSATSANLGKIRSGELDMELLFTAKGGGRTGFDLAGPFALHAGGLPDAQLDYTQIAGDKTATQTFIATGDKAYVQIRGETFELPQKTADQIRSTVGASNGLGAIDLSNWVMDPTLGDGGQVGGADTDKVHAKLNVPAAVSGLLAVASQVNGASAQALSGTSAEQVQRAVSSATIDVWTGKDDRLLRKL